MKDLISQIQEAFAHRTYPGDDNITRCTYDKKHGGQYAGPCGECMDMAEFFCGRRWQAVTATELRQHGDADCLFTIEAYCYYLPAYLVAALANPGELDVCLDHLTYRFGPEPKDAFGNDRLSAIFIALSKKELQTLLAYFKNSYKPEEDFRDFHARSISNLEQELLRR
jgi:hypothetical protein